MLPELPPALKRAIKLAALAVWLADSYHVYRFLEDYYKEDREDVYDDDRLAEDRRVLELFSDDCAPATLVDKKAYEVALEDLKQELKDADPKEGMWPPNDPSLKIMGESMVFLGGGRATFLQLAFPFVAQGIKLHSKIESGVRRRFNNTFKYMFAMNFGTQGEMFNASRAVRALHDPVHGEFDERGSNMVFKTGSKFDAHQVNAIRWVGASLLETAVFQYEMIVGPVENKDGLLRGSSRTLRLFGVLPSPNDPKTWKEFRRFNSAMWRSPALRVSTTAKEMAEFLLLPPSVMNQPLLDMVWWTTFVSMPPKLAEQYYGRRINWVDKVLFALWTGLIRFIYRLMPLSFRQLWAYTKYRERVQGGLWLHERILSSVAGFMANHLLDVAMPNRDPEVARKQVQIKMAKRSGTPAVMAG